VVKMDIMVMVMKNEKNDFFNEKRDFRRNKKEIWFYMFKGKY